MPMMRQSQHQQRSVRRAMAIQLIINKNSCQNENPIQGAFIIEELTDLVEALLEFDRITERGGVLVLWKPCTNVLKFKKKACIMKR
jgi:methylmalonyl-CoA mutase N-terminal domain/subunit